MSMVKIRLYRKHFHLILDHIHYYSPAPINVCTELKIHLNCYLNNKQTPRYPEILIIRYSGGLIVRYHRRLYIVMAVLLLLFYSGLSIMKGQTKASLQDISGLVSCL
jgi:uncharacterized membrane protein